MSARRVALHSLIALSAVCIVHVIAYTSALIYCTLSRASAAGSAEIWLAALYLALSIALATTYRTLRRPEDERLSFTEATQIVVISWILSSAITTIPFMVIQRMDFVDALFESISGLTGTGLTMIKDVESAPASIKILRSMLQWFGEIGIVAIIVSIFARAASPIVHLYAVERAGISEELAGGRVMFRAIKDALRAYFGVYVLYTVVGAALLYLFGMNLLDAICHAMTGISTGGFSTRGENVGSYLREQGVNVVGILATLSVLMFLGSINFRYHSELLRGRVLKLILSLETGYLLATYLTLLSALVASLILIDKLSLNDALLSGYFELLSALTTTGFTICSVRGWSDVSKMILTVAMVIGGSTCSTAGGIKVYRVAVMLKFITWEIRRLLRPEELVVMRVPEVGRLTYREIAITLMFILVYVFVLLAVSLVLTAYGFPLVDSLFETASALGCAGLSVGITSPSLDVVPKSLLMVCMLLGRLEILPFLIAIASIRR